MSENLTEGSGGHVVEKLRDKTLTGDIRERFTHLIALIITVPLIVATFILLLSDGNHSEEFTFISGLLGVIIGFYFGARGIENAEIGKKQALAEKENAEDVTAHVKSKAEMMREANEKYLGKVVKELNRYKKKEAWFVFKENVKEENVKKNRKDFEGVEHFNQYSPWHIPEEGWNEKENELLDWFEDHWESYATAEEQWGVY